LTIYLWKECRTKYNIFQSWRKWFIQLQLRLWFTMLSSCFHFMYVVPASNNDLTKFYHKSLLLLLIFLLLVSLNFKVSRKSTCFPPPQTGYQEMAADVKHKASCRKHDGNVEQIRLCRTSLYSCLFLLNLGIVNVNLFPYNWVNWSVWSYVIWIYQDI
jgi:hypothetical protein